MRVYERDLQEKANIYIRNGVLIKYRPAKHNELFKELRKTGTKLNSVEMEFLMSLDAVVIEEEKYVQFINFSGVIQLDNGNPYHIPNSAQSKLSSLTVKELLMSLEIDIYNSASIREDMSAFEYLKDYFKQ